MWTIQRGAHVKSRPPERARVVDCASCGAPIDHIDVAGHCKSCHAKVTSGEFDWTLSRIEQDEVYRS